ncbi:MAG: hypothetical protein JNM47_07615 [Hyphomonadaceae bacterium]|nr:hypothetical protein [Hyphomonadaceae bacterium]
MPLSIIDDAKTGVRRATVAIALIFVLQCITLFVTVATSMHLSDKIDALHAASAIGASP